MYVQACTKTWEKAPMLCVDLLPHCVPHKPRPVHPTVLGKQWCETKSTALLSPCYPSLASICKNCQCKWHLAEKRIPEKSKNCHLPTTLQGALEHTKEYNSLNATQYCSKIISTLFIVCELQQWEKKKKN